ncbi:fibronectin type III domain-containing protein [Breznakiellaceae bacterium SP9]
MNKNVFFLAGCVLTVLLAISACEMPNETGSSFYSKIQEEKGRPPMPTALAAPTAPSVIPWNGELTVSWGAVDGAESYEVWIGTTNDLSGMIQYGNDVSNTSVTITALTNGTSYYVQIKAKNSVESSEFSPAAIGMPSATQVGGLYKGVIAADHRVVIANQNLAGYLSYIASNTDTGDNWYIVLGANESLPSTTLWYSDKTGVGITLIGTGAERTITISGSGALFVVYSGVTLTLDNNITLKGNNSNTTELVSIQNSSALVMNNGSKIIDNTSGGGVRVDSRGTFTMNGGTISGNTDGGLSVFGGTFTMNDGTISGNTSGEGGGVWISSGTFTMNGGTISGNTASGGGGVKIGGGSTATFTMNGGTISGNTASFGGGVYVLIYNGGGAFTMNGGTISGNTAGSGGGGVYVQILNGGAFSKTVNGNGIIYGSDASPGLKNSAGGNGDAVYLPITYSNSAVPPLVKKRNTTVNAGEALSSSTSNWD